MADNREQRPQCDLKTITQTHLQTHHPHPHSPLTPLAHKQHTNTLNLNSTFSFVVAFTPTSIYNKLDFNLKTVKNMWKIIVPATANNNTTCTMANGMPRIIRFNLIPIQVIYFDVVWWPPFTLQPHFGRAARNTVII